MLHAGHHAVAQGDDAVDDVSVAKCESAGNLLVGEPHPAAVQADGLGQQNQFLPVIADLLFSFLVFRTSHHQVVLNTGELAVLPQPRRKGLRLIHDQLDVQSALFIDPVDLRPELGDFRPLDGLVEIFPHGMPCLDSFDEFHRFVVSQCFLQK